MNITYGMNSFSLFTEDFIFNNLYKELNSSMRDLEIYHKDLINIWNYYVDILNEKKPFNIRNQEYYNGLLKMLVISDMSYMNVKAKVMVGFKNKSDSLRADELRELISDFKKCIKLQKFTIKKSTIVLEGIAFNYYN